MTLSCLPFSGVEHQNRFIQLFSCLQYKLLTIALPGVLLSLFASTTVPLSHAAGVEVATVRSAADEVHAFNVPAGPLDTALDHFAHTAGVNLYYDAALLGGLQSKGLSGNYSIGVALSLLLAGSGIEAIAQSGGGYALHKVPAVGNSSGEATVLPLMTVSTTVTSTDGSADQGYRSDHVPALGPWEGRALKDTPYSVSFIPKQLIETVIAGDMDQIYKMNPIVQNSAPSTVYGTPYAAIRGFHSQSGVMDGLRLSSTSTGIAMEELERVEIMNGLSGFMYGVGNPGGVTNYILKRPTYERTIALRAGNYGNKQWFGHIDLGNRIDSDGIFAYRLNISHQNGETSKKDQKVQRTLVSGALDWNINPNLLVQVEAAHTYYRVDGIDSRFYAYSDSSFGALDYWIAPLKNNKTYTPSWTFLETKTHRIGTNVKFAINDTFSFRGAYLYKRDVQESINLYPAFFADSGFANGWPSRSAPSYNIAQGAYAYLDSVFSTVGIGHKLTVGVSGDTLHVRRHATNFVNATNSPSYTDPYDLMTWAMPPAFNDQNWGRTHKSSDSRNYNIIVGDDIQFTDSLSALIGFNRSQIVTKNYDGTGEVTASYDKAVITPTVSLLFKPIETVTTYASYIEGLEKGSIIPNDPLLYNEPGKILKPFISKQYEIGTKYAPTDNFLITGALYRIEKANSYEEIGSDGKRTINQDGLEIHQGIELTATGQVTKNLTLIVGGTLMDLSTKKITNAAFQGKKPTGVASTLAKIYAQYMLPGVSGLSLSGGAFYSGSMYKDAANLQKIDGYVVFDIGLHYRTRIARHPVSFNLNVANLTDKSYWATSYSLGIPRNIAFSVRTEL